jgi:hypothetical protein
MNIIPAIQEEDFTRIIVRGQPRQKVSKTPSPSISQVCWFISVISAIRVVIDTRITAQGQHQKKAQDSIKKITKAKKIWSASQVIEHPPCKVRSLVQTPISPKEKKKAPSFRYIVISTENRLIHVFKNNSGAHR